MIILLHDFKIVWWTRDAEIKWKYKHEDHKNENCFFKWEKDKKKKKLQRRIKQIPEDWEMVSGYSTGDSLIVTRWIIKQRSRILK